VIKVEKFNKIVEFFSNRKIDIPTDTKNAIEDVFKENDNINDVDIYFKEDAELLESDLVLLKEIDSYLTEPSSGSVDDVYTYHGEIDYTVSEFYNLYDNRKDQKTLAEIVNIDNQGGSSKLNRDQWAAVMVETTKWDEGKIEKKQKVFIYCPIDSGDGEAVDNGKK
jgi:hypothetical protein